MKWLIIPVCGLAALLLSCSSDKPTEPKIRVPTVTTAGITGLTQSTAICGGDVTADGGATVTARGVCWCLNPSPTTADSMTADGAGTGVFTSSLSGLISNTPYYVRAYATNSAGTGYGDIQSFTTASPAAPTLTTVGVTAATQTSAICGGEVTSDGGVAVTVRGVCWSTNPDPTTADNKTTDGPGRPAALPVRLPA